MEKQTNKQQINDRFNFSEEDYVQIHVAAKIGAWALELVDNEPPRLYCNDIMEELIGVPHGTAPEKCYMAHDAGMVPEYKGAIRKYTQEIISKGRSEVTYRWRYKNGKEISIRCVGVIDRSFKNGVRMRGFHQDITENYEIERERDRYLEALKKVYFVTSYWDFEKDTIKIINPGTYNREMYEGRKKGIQDVVDTWANTDLTPEVREANKEFWNIGNIKQRLRDADVITRDVQTLSNGWCHLQVIAIERAENGEVKSAAWIARKIDNELQRELEARERTSAFSRLYYLAACIDLRDLSYVRLHCDESIPRHEAFASMQEEFDYSRKKLMPQEFRSALKQFWDLSTVEKRLGKKNMISIDVKNPDNKWVRGYFLPVDRDQDGKLIHVIYSAMNIDDQKRKEIAAKKKELENEAALAAAYNEAKQANEAKTEFLSSMSHDIRTPMNAITGMADIALNCLDDMEKVKDSLEKIKLSGHQLISLVNDVLDISAIESGKLQLHRTPFCLKDGFSKIRAVYEQQMLLRSQIGEFSVHDIICPWVMADEVRISQIVSNLIGNAIKYTPDGGKIRSEVYQEHTENGFLDTVIVIRDTGIGMSDEFMKKMFDSFSRATDTRINTVQGTGLGLPIVKRLVDLMGGRIEVDSRINEGTTFKVTLPLPASKNMDGENAKNKQKTERLCINALVAEDNDLNWEIAKELLKLNGVTSTRAVNGEKCVSLFTESEKETYDVILMDMQMPVMDGVEATKRIRMSEHPKAQTIPIIAMTANAFNDDVQKCMNAGMNDHLSKPIEIDKVITTIKKYI